MFGDFSCVYVIDFQFDSIVTGEHTLNAFGSFRFAEFYLCSRTWSTLVGWRRTCLRRRLRWWGCGNFVSFCFSYLQLWCWVHIHSELTHLLGKFTLSSLDCVCVPSKRLSFEDNSCAITLTTAIFLWLTIYVFLSFYFRSNIGVSFLLTEYSWVMRF